MNDRIKAFADFITKQVNEGVVISEAKEKSSVTKNIVRYVMQHKKIPEDEKRLAQENTDHVGSHGDHHVYSIGGESPPKYVIHNEKTGETEHFTLPDKELSSKHVNQKMEKVMSGTHPTIVRKLTDYHNSGAGGDER